MNPTQRTLLPAIPALLLCSLALSTTPAQAEEVVGILDVRVYFEDGWTYVQAPSGWTCTLESGGAGIAVEGVLQVDDPTGLVQSHSLSCQADDPPAFGPQSAGLFAACTSQAMLVAGVQQQTGDLGHTQATAVCDLGRAQCDGVVVLNVPDDCSVGVLGQGLAKCLFVTTVNVNYNRVGICQIPIVSL